MDGRNIKRKIQLRVVYSLIYKTPNYIFVV